jgi:DnaJ-class molecular chaperone
MSEFQPPDIEQLDYSGRVLDLCDACNGSGVDQVKDRTRCEWCAGRGHILVADSQSDASGEVKP